MCCRYVLECVNCGVIYRSRQHWYGNVEPEKTGLVQTRIQHVWPEVGFCLHALASLAVGHCGTCLTRFSAIYFLKFTLELHTV